MDLVSQFSEKSNEIIEWESGMPEHSRVRKELDAICDWWIHKYPNREQELPDFPDIDFGKVSDGNHEDDPDVQEWRRIADIHNNKEVVWRQEEMEMLIRVMKIRNHLWY